VRGVLEQHQAAAMQALRRRGEVDNVGADDLARGEGEGDLWNGRVPAAESAAQSSRSSVLCPPGSALAVPQQYTCSPSRGVTAKRW
jgi:hypothetical protein